MPVKIIKRKAAPPKVLSCRSIQIRTGSGGKVYECTVCQVEVRPGKSDPCQCGTFKFPKES